MLQQLVTSTNAISNVILLSSGDNAADALVALLFALGYLAAFTAGVRLALTLPWR